MIYVKTIQIEEFRGIRDLTLDFNNKNFAVCGPNGTGKSGVIDALEFALTGNISRLSGRGTGSVTLKKHAPHVDSRTNPEKSKVKVTLCIPSLGNQKVEIERSVKEHSSPKITPEKPEVLEVLQQLEKHPEFVLSRRELIGYILAQPADRATQIQELLRLDKIGELRGTLKKIYNACKKEEKSLEKMRSQAGSKLMEALDISKLTSEQLLEAANTRRSILKLPEITKLTKTSTLHVGLKTIAKDKTVVKVNKLEANKDLESIVNQLSKLSAAEAQEKCLELRTQITEFGADPIASSGASRENFLQTAINLATENICPLCDTKWDIEDLKNLIKIKLKKYEEISKIRKNIENNLEPFIDVLMNLKTALGPIIKHAEILTPENVTLLSEYQKSLTPMIKSLKEVFPAGDTISVLERLVCIPKDLEKSIDEITKKVATIPEPNEQEAARDYLILCQERLERYRESKRNEEIAKEQISLAKTVYDLYIEESDKMLENIYDQVAEEFGEFYRLINQEDEKDFTAKLVPSDGKLSFDVEFYGRGHFPPGAYHSEGHQDGMGLCLYLSLMKKLQGENFKFAVLDDVLMSVDIGHRREVCNLLKEKFPNTQFIFTTHDKVWLKHMGSAGLIDQGQSIRFSNWSPDHGPTEWGERDVWAEIDSALTKDDVQNASSLLRHYLEYFFEEVCHNLQAPVRFRGDGKYELGDVLPAGVKQFKKLLKDGRGVATSWGDTKCVEEIQKKEESLKKCFQETEVERWQVNPAIHYNAWANLSPQDFLPVVKAFKALTNKFLCEKQECGSVFYLAGKKDSLRCRCGNQNINLIKK